MNQIALDIKLLSSNADAPTAQIAAAGLDSMQDIQHAQLL